MGESSGPARVDVEAIAGASAGACAAAAGDGASGGAGTICGRRREAGAKTSWSSAGASGDYAVTVTEL